MGWAVGVLGFIVTVITCVNIQSWTPFLLFFLLWIALYYLIREENKEKKKKEEQEKTRQEVLSQERYAQERIKQEALTREIQKKERKQRIVQLVANSQLLSQNLSGRVNLARNALGAAEQEYQEGAFAPFWDAVERAVTNLAHFNDGINQITQNCADYQTESRQLDSPSPVFDWKRATDFPDAAALADRLQKIVRSAQKNFQFAVIYEQRKTNQILVAGFAGLGHALSEIAYRIDESTATLSVALANLSFTVSDTSEKTIEASRENARAIIASTQAIRKQTKAEAEVEAEARREHERRELEMLDNIQRGEEPSFPDYQGGLR